MSDCQEVWTEIGADHMIGRRVKLTQHTAQRYIGESGTVTGKQGWRGGFRLIVVWDIGFADGRIRVDYLTPEEFRRLLQVIP